MENPGTEEPPRLRSELAALSRRIRNLREKRGLTQEDFARRCGISASFASLLERAERTPSYETLVQVSEALAVPLGELFRDSSAETYEDPSFSKLVDFARARRLSRTQIDRFLAVGEAMFGEVRGPAERPVSSGPLCGQSGCQKPVLAKGLCVSHYHRTRRAKR
jgi:transcriptional regulator with XRE-family HTH domain